MLYTVYSLPNMVLPFLGGAFVDKYGTNLSLLLFSSIIFLGQLVFAAGSSFVSLNTMLVRFHSSASSAYTHTLMICCHVVGL